MMANFELNLGNMRNIISYVRSFVGGTYWNPVRMLRSDDLPAPEGPIIAVSSPDLNFPLMPLITVFFSVKKDLY